MTMCKNPVDYNPIETCKRWVEQGIYWVGSIDAAAVLGIDRYAMTETAKTRGLGSIYYSWAGNRLMVSTASILKFLTGGEDISRIFGGKEESRNGKTVHSHRTIR